MPRRNRRPKPPRRPKVEKTPSTRSGKHYEDLAQRIATKNVTQ